MDAFLSQMNYWIVMIVNILYIFTIISSIIVVLSENRNPIRSLAWVIALIFLPVVGLIFYLFFGRSLKGKHMMSRSNRRKMMNTFQIPRVDLSETELSDAEKRLVKLAGNICDSNYCDNNSIELLANGHEKFERLKEELMSARESICLQYYIFSDDETGSEIADILMLKAQQGVDVKVIYDSVGSFSTSNKFFRRMAENDVKIHPFFRVTFRQLANRVNWRNHRKVVVIDGAVAYIGGMNIADRYRTGIKGDLQWHDIHFRLTGDIVASVLRSFMIDWNFMNANGEDMPPRIAPVEIKNATGMQFIASGPMSRYDSISLFYLKAISQATKRIYIQTPYFLPTDALLHALEAAALSNIDVRIMMPRHGDSKMLEYASFSYVTQCLKAGIKVYLYVPGMLHNKSMIIDDDLAIVGSVNFDFRSFENNFECALAVYDAGFNSEMRELFFNQTKDCKKLSYAVWHARPRLHRTFESIVRLVSPIL